MDFTQIGIMAFGILIFLVIMGVHIAWATPVVAFGGLWALFGLEQAATQFFTTAFSTGSEFLFASIPLFIFMGQIVSQSRIGEDLFASMYRFLGHLPGGLLVTTIGACAGFGAVTGVSSAAVGTMSRIALPELRLYKYDMTLSTGSLASAATIAIMIPPSLLMVLYGLWTETSIGKLFLAGIVPGILTAIIFSLYVVIRCRLNPALGPKGPSFSLREKMTSLLKVIPIVVIFTVVVLGMYVGLFTPGEAAAVGVSFTVFVAFAMRRIGWSDLRIAVESTVKLSAMIFCVLIAASVLARFLVATQVTTMVTDAIQSVGLNRYLVLFLIYVLYLILGCLLDAFGMILLTLPFVFPIIIHLGFDPVWFGIVLVLLTEIALITPPVGLNVFILSKMTKDATMAEIFKGAMPFVLLSLGVILLLTVFPGIALWLPNTMIH
jgi:tripartite ATP-independent transporter DctM subunit